VILAGDIGGTKTLLALFDSSRRCVTRQQFASAEFETFDDLLRVFLQSKSVNGLQSICLGVAGPIVDGDCNTTNLPWCLRKQKIAAISGVENVVLLNDLQATAWGVLSLSEQDFIELNTDADSKKGNIAILAAGTGLGEAIISWDGAKNHVLSTEGGHTDFAPTDELEIELLRYLKRKYAGHVSYERVVSGMGLVNIYEFLKSKGFLPVSAETEQLMTMQDKAAVISAKSQAGEDELCIKTTQMFCRCYGAEAGNLALKTLSYGGVVLAGGIAAKNLSLIKQGEFMRAFMSKGRYQQVLQNMSVKVCVNHEAALIGAAEYARKLKA